jgi:hypothetical protein
VFTLWIAALQFEDFRKKKKNVIERKMGVLILATTLSKTLLILRRIQRDTIKMYFGLHVKYPLFVSDFNETGILWTDFRKMSKYQISRKYVSWKPSFILRRTDGRRDTTKLTVAFRSVANEPKSSI